MIVSCILLSPDNVYVDQFDSLPDRPDFDKELLTTLCRNMVVSSKGYEMLPPSIRALVIENPSREPEIGITIDEIDALTDLLIVVRSKTRIDGRRFRLDRFEPIVIDTKIEIWKRK